MPDEAINCADCRAEFIFTESEATFFASKELTKPRRCKACRQKRKDAKAGEVGATASPIQAVPAKGRTQWVGGGESEAPRRDNGGKKFRKRDRHSGDSGF